MHSKNPHQLRFRLSIESIPDMELDQRCQQCLSLQFTQEGELSRCHLSKRLDEDVVLDWDVALIVFGLLGMHLERSSVIAEDELDDPSHLRSEAVDGNSRSTRLPRC